MRKQILKNARGLKKRRTYTAGELLRALGIHRQTLQAWRDRGLSPISKDVRPWLYLGQTVKDFARRLHAKGKCHLEPDQFWCLKCKAARRSTRIGPQIGSSSSWIEVTRPTSIIEGVCEVCGCRIRRFGSRVVSPTTKRGSNQTRLNKTNKYDDFQLEH